MNNRKIGLAIVALIVAFGIGFFAKPAKVKIETKEVVKTVTVKQEGKVRIVYREKVTNPDGTITEKETEREDTHSSENTQSEASRTASNETTRDSGLTLQALAIVDVKDIGGDREYGLYAKKRVFGNVSVGALVTTDKKIGLGIGFDF